LSLVVALIEVRSDVPTVEIIFSFGVSGGAGQNQDKIRVSVSWISAASVVDRGAATRR
jgi:hypothetical protein